MDNQLMAALLAKADLCLSGASPGVLSVAQSEHRIDHGVLTITYRFSIAPEVIKLNVLETFFNSLTGLAWIDHPAEKDFPCIKAEGTVDGHKVVLVLILGARSG